MARARLTADTLRGIWAGITLSWNDDWTLDERSLRQNLERLCAHHVNGIYTTGSTGEFYALSFSEFQRMVGIVASVVLPAGIPLQIGCCADDTRDVLRLVGCAADAGADGVQIVVPYWMELSDRELLQYFKDIASAFPGLPLVHYNIPRAKRFLAGADYRRILEVAPDLIGVKFTYAGSHFGQLQEALQLAPELSFFVGEDMLVSAMQLGARGSYSSMICTDPAFMQRLYALAEARQWDEAMRMQGRLCEFFREAGAFAGELGLGDSDPVFDKGLGVASGFVAGHPRTRPPYIGWSDGEVARVRAWLAERYPEFLAPDEA